MVIAAQIAPQPHQGAEFAMAEENKSWAEH
jgi:hypothetical protein